jgi:hypothetical protein
VARKRSSGSIRKLRRRKMIFLMIYLIVMFVSLALILATVTEKEGPLDSDEFVSVVLACVFWPSTFSSGGYLRFKEWMKERDA